MTFSLSDQVLKNIIWNEAKDYTIKPTYASSTGSYFYLNEASLNCLAENFEKIEEKAAQVEKEKKKIEEAKIHAKNKRLRALVKHVHWSGNTCIVYWNDGTQTKARWDAYEDFDPEKAILVCMARKLYEGTGIYNEVLSEYAPDGWDYGWKNKFFD